jgi:hypothetical protein
MLFLITALYTLGTSAFILLLPSLRLSIGGEPRVAGLAVVRLGAGMLLTSAQLASVKQQEIGERLQLLVEP